MREARVQLRHDCAPASLGVRPLPAALDVWAKKPARCSTYGAIKGLANSWGRRSSDSFDKPSVWRCFLMSVQQFWIRNREFRGDSGSESGLH